jgi:hypothetical protein
MRSHLKVLLAGLAVVGLASPAVARWKAGNTVYPTLSACFAQNKVCKFIGELVRLNDAASLTPANEGLQSRRRAATEVVYYRVVTPGLSRRALDESGLPVGTNDGQVDACLMASGSVHKGKCAKGEVLIRVIE